jgi:hypothetical protein
MNFKENLNSKNKLRRRSRELTFKRILSEGLQEARMNDRKGIIKIGCEAVYSTVKVVECIKRYCKSLSGAWKAPRQLSAWITSCFLKAFLLSAAPVARASTLI